MTDIVAKFENSLGRRHKLRVKDANPALEPEAVRASLEKLTTVDLFRKKDACLFDKVLSASYIETIETYIFDDSIDEEVCEVCIEEPTTAEEAEELRVLAQPEIPVALPSLSMTDWNIILIQEEMVEPTLLKQVLELPPNVTMNHLSEKQKRSLVTSKMPEGGQPITANIYKESNHILIELLAELKEEIREKDKSSPLKDKHRRWRLLDRFKKRR